MRKTINLIVAVLVLVSCSGTKKLKEALEVEISKVEILAKEFEAESTKAITSTEQKKVQQFGDTLKGTIPTVISLNPVIITASSNGVDLTIVADSTGTSYKAIAKPVTTTATNTTSQVDEFSQEKESSKSQNKSSQKAARKTEISERKSWFRWYWLLLLILIAAGVVLLKKYTKPVSFLVELYNLIFKTKTRE